MARVTKKAVIEAIDEWAELQARRQEIDATREEQLAPLRARFEKRCAPILAADEDELRSIQVRCDEIETMASEYLLSELESDGSVKLRKLSGAQAHAEVLTASQREIEPSKFFAALTDRTERFWGCVKVLVQKAEKAYGDKINEFAKLKVNHRVVINLNEETKSD